MNTYNAAYVRQIDGWIQLPQDDISDFQVLNFGVQHGQYFDGVGLEDWDDVAIGGGEDYNEALEDAINQLDGSQRWPHSALWEIYDVRCKESDHNEQHTVSQEIYDGEIDGDEDWRAEFSFHVAVRVRRVNRGIDMNAPLFII